MEENNKYDAQSIDGCKKYLENIIHGKFAQKQSVYGNCG